MSSVQNGPPDLKPAEWMQIPMRKGMVSVIMPVYNRATIVVDALESVRSQLYSPIELIVIDDGSTDDTCAVISEWIRAQNASEGFAVRLVQTKNLGGAAARNMGLKLSQGEYIQFLDSDDVIHPLKIFRQVEALESSPTRHGAYGNWRAVRKLRDGFAVYEPATPLRQTQFLRELLGKRNFCVPHAFLWRRTAAQVVGPWDETLAADQDGDYALSHVLAFGAPLFVPDSWSYYIGHGEQLSADRSRRTFESRIRVIDKARHRLLDDGRLAEFTAELAASYEQLASAYALGFPGGTKRCLERLESISGAYGFSEKARFFYRVLARALRRKLAVRSRVERLYRPAKRKGYQGKKLVAICRTLEGID